MKLFYEHVIPFLATLAAAYSFGWRIKALKVGVPGWEAMNGVIAALSLFYVGAWSLLWTGVVSDRTAWSRYVAIISAATFVIVWAWPARKQVKDRDRLRDELMGKTDGG